jgi:hypothetical protein
MTADAEAEFASKIKSIRPKTLRNFLLLYYYAHLHPSKENNPLIPPKARERIERRAPRVFPGIRQIRNFLACSKGAAQDYLRAIYINREIFGAASTPQQTQIEHIHRKDYEQLLKDLIPNFEQISKLLSLKQIAPRQRANQIRILLTDTSRQISEQTGFFTPNECTQIIKELANWLV